MVAAHSSIARDSEARLRLLLPSLLLLLSSRQGVLVADRQHMALRVPVRKVWVGGLLLLCLGLGLGLLGIGLCFHLLRALLALLRNLLAQLHLPRPR